MRRAPLAVALTVLAGLALLLVPGTWASFSDSATVTSTSAGFTSGSIAKPANATATQTATTSVTLTWPATSVGNQGGTASAYVVYRWTAATGGTSIVACTAAGALTCTDANAPASGAWYSLRARVGDNWVKDGDRVAYTPDVTGPSVAFTRPVSGTTSYTALATAVASSCGANVVACGTVTDPAGVAKVEYSYRRAGLYNYCWSGSDWAQTSASSCAFVTLPSGASPWTIPGATSDAYEANPLGRTFNYTLTIRATDRLGNVTPTATLTFSTTNS